MDEGHLGIDLTIQDVASIITGFACWLIGIVLAIMVIFLVIAGIRYFLARGNETKVTDATKNLTWTLVGILVILATNVIIATISNALGRDYSFIPLNCGSTEKSSVQPPPNSPPVANPRGPYQGFTNNGKENTQPSTTEVRISDLSSTFSPIFSQYYILGTPRIIPEEIFHFNPQKNSGWFYIAQTIPENSIAFWVAAVRSLSTNPTDTSAQLLYGITNTNNRKHYSGFLDGGSFSENSDKTNLFYKKDGKKILEFQQTKNDLTEFKLKVSLPWDSTSLQTTKTLTLSRPILYESGDGVVPMAPGVDSLYASIVTDQGFWIDFQKFNIGTPFLQMSSRFYEANHRWGSFILSKRSGILPSGTIGTAWEILDRNNQRQSGGYTNVDFLIPGFPQFTAKEAQIEMGKIEEIETWDSGHKTYLKKWKMSYPGGIELLFETVIPNQENGVMGQYFYEGMIKVIDPKTGEVVGTGMLEQTHNEAWD